MNPIERDWQQNEAEQRQPTDRLKQLLSALPAVPVHDSGTLTRRVRQAIHHEPAWMLPKAGVERELGGGAVDRQALAALPAVPGHDSTGLQAAIRDQLGTPVQRVEYLACGLAAGFLDEEETHAAAHRLATDVAAREAFARHEKLEGMLAEWSRTTEAAVASADCSRLHEAIQAEIAPVPVVIPFPQAGAVGQRRRLTGWLLGGLSVAAALAGVWVGVRWQMQTIVPSKVADGTVVARGGDEKPVHTVRHTPAELELAFAGPSLAPPRLARDAVLMVAIAPTRETTPRLSNDSALLPADDAEARPRGTVTVAVDTPARNLTDENGMYF